MKTGKFCYSLLSSIFVSSNLCFGMEYNVTNNRFETNQFFHELGSKNSSCCLGSGCSAYVLKSNYNNQPVALKIFKPNNADKSKDEIGICKKIYEYSKKRDLNQNLMKILGISYAVSSLDPKDRRDAIIFERINGITLTEWKEKFKFSSVDSFIDDFCIPVINAFQEYYRITGKLKSELTGENIMMKSEGGIWKPVLIDYGPGSDDCVYFVYNTLLLCCSYVSEKSDKLCNLSDFLNRKVDEQLDIDESNANQNIDFVNELLEEIRKIRNN